MIEITRVAIDSKVDMKTLGYARDYINSPRFKEANIRLNYVLMKNEKFEDYLEEIKEYIDKYPNIKTVSLKTLNLNTRKDVRKLKDKKLQVLLDNNYNLPRFEINEKEDIKVSASKEVEKLFNTPYFYVEQLDTWGNPEYYTKYSELTITYLVIINKNNIKNVSKNLDFYDIHLISVSEEDKFQKMTLENEKNTEKVVKESAYRPSNQYVFNDSFYQNWAK